MNKVFIFDMDDTLYSEVEYVKSGFKHIAKQIFNQFNTAEIEIYNSLFELYKFNSSNVFNRLYEKYDIAYTKDDIDVLINEYRNHKPNIKLAGDALPFIKMLKAQGVKLGLITDGYKEAQRNKIKALNLEEYMDYIIVTDELGREFWKPHQKSFIMMKEYFNVEYNEMTYLGDNIKKDFKAGNELGMHTIMISRKNKIHNSAKKLDEIYLPKEIINKL